MDTVRTHSDLAMIRDLVAQGPSAALGDFFTAPYLTRALLIVLLLAIPAGILGVWIILRRMAFFTHVVGQSTFPALVLATIVGWSLLATSIVAAAAVAVVLGLIAGGRRLEESAHVALALAGALALGAFLVSDVADPGVSVNGLLFGSLLSTTREDVWAAGILAAVTLVAAVVTRRTMTVATFDPMLARTEGSRRTRLTEILVLVLLATTVAVSVRMVGTLLVGGLFLIPAATARLLTSRIATLMPVAVLLAAATGTVGLVVADATAWPPGATIAVTSAATFIVVMALATAARHVRPLARLFPT